MRAYALGLVVVSLTLSAVARADDVCSAQEHRAGNAAAAKAKAAEAAGDLKQALALAQDGDVRVCSAEGDALATRLALRLAQAAEKAGQLNEAFDYFEIANAHEDAKRVALARFRAAPTNPRVSGDVLAFMKQHDFADGIAEIEKNARAQAARVLGEEDKAFKIREPHTELLDQARDWLSLASDDQAATVKQRALQRADQYAALDYKYALEQSLNYYERAGNKDKPAAVHAKARKLADGLASGERWGEAVELYEVAGDRARADSLRASHEAKAATVEAARKDTFEKGTDALEKELGL